MNINNFSFKENFYIKLFFHIKEVIFQKITSRSVRLFLKGGDLISSAPQVLGVYEPAITSLINYLSKNKYGDFLIDIGANIGLTSCQNGANFKRVDMYEPNPLCCKILEVNSAISLNNGDFFIHPFGLGNEDKNVLLCVPKHNWGGGFIKDSGNSYGDSIFAEKDGFQSIDENNYLLLDASIVCTQIELARLFNELCLNNLTRGVIKIDVEGYELSVLKGIADSIPNNIDAIILFESWDSHFPLDDVLNAFKGRAKAYRLSHALKAKSKYERLIISIAALFRRYLYTKIIPVRNGEHRGDLILLIDNCIK